MPAMPVKVIVTYSHHDVAYLGDDSLLGYLKELEQENVTFWTDRNVGVRESWDEVIKANIQDAHIALILVSQSFFRLLLLHECGNQLLSCSESPSYPYHSISLQLATLWVAAQSPDVA
ncbi:MAG: hypothetical protein ETSY2_13180 [Candidatus Entotheonella gemina]|uniref:TIR domain-containing protein n=1 Tax=Candidatus Entotheonella gemina TaxID=1429439 RepID=W4MBS1_9BACT|nr:MAG: hypothetical protein ETSY2_13180 [Candidatus Entotheonella gemina]